MKERSAISTTTWINYLALVWLLTGIAAPAWGQEVRRRRTLRAPQTLSVPRTQEAGAITGRVFDADGEGLVGVRVIVEGTAAGTVTDYDGGFRLELPTGKYRLRFSLPSYSEKVVDDVGVGGKTMVLNVVLSEMAEHILETVVVEARWRESSAAALTVVQKNDLRISDGYSGDLILKETPDFQTNTVLRRMPGVALIGEKYLVIRGLAERYNVTSLNDAILPITDLERVGFDYNLIPAHLVSSVRLIKSATADMFGEIGGGYIQFNTSAVPSENGFRAFVQGGWDSRASFRTIGQYPTVRGRVPGLPQNFASAEALLAAGSGSETSLAAGRSLYRATAPQTGVAPPALNAGVSLVRRFGFRGGEWGFSGAVGYQNHYHSHDVRSLNVLNSPAPGKSKVSEIIEQTDNFRLQNTTGIFNAGVKVGKYGSVSLHNFLSYSMENRAADMRGMFVSPFESGDTTRYEIIPMRFIARLLYAVQMTSEWKLTDKRGWTYAANVGANLSTLSTDDPGYRATAFEERDGRLLFANAGFYSRTLSARQFDFYRGGRIEWRLERRIGVHEVKFFAGFFGLVRSKNYRSRLFALLFDYDGQGNEYTDLAPEVYSRDNLSNIFAAENIRPGGFNYYEMTDRFDNYDAFSYNAAGFAGADWRWKNLVRLNVGVRPDYFVQQIAAIPVGLRRFALVDSRMTDVLPSATLVVSPTERMNVRASYAQTLNRPIDREIVPLVYFNLQNGVRSTGNPALVRSKLHNVDVRYEYFWDGADLVSVSLLYKAFEMPIEQVVTESVLGGAQLLDLRNAQKAAVAGIELDFRQNIGRWAPKIEWMRRFTIYTNATLLRSRINVTDLSGLFSIGGRPLQGQAPYVVNAGLIFDDPDWGLNVSMFYHRVGPKIAVAGSPRTFMGSENSVFPSFYELPRDVFDVQIGKKIGRFVELRLTASDIFNTPVRWVQILDPKGRHDPARDPVVRDIRRGVQLFLGIAVKF